MEPNTSQHGQVAESAVHIIVHGFHVAGFLAAGASSQWAARRLVNVVDGWVLRLAVHPVNDEHDQQDKAEKNNDCRADDSCQNAWLTDDRCPQRHASALRFQDSARSLDVIIVEVTKLYVWLIWKLINLVPLINGCCLCPVRAGTQSRGRLNGRSGRWSGCRLLL